MFPSHPLFRRFENELTVGEQKLEWTIWGDDFVFRPQEAEEVIVWFFLGRRDIPSRLQPQHNVANIKDCEIRIEQAVYGRQLWRWGRLPSGEECFLRKNYGIFRTANNELVRFDFPFAFSNFEQAKGDEIEAFYKMLSSPDSDLETAKRWADTSNQQRVRQLFHLIGGSHDEFEALISAAVVLNAHESNTFSLPEAVISGRVVLETKLRWGINPLNRFFDILNRYFYLERTKEDWRGHDNFGDPMDVPYPVYTSTEPTQHERIEALLIWRDFLRDKLPPEEIEALLPKF